MHYSSVKPSCTNFRVITENFRVSEILGFFTGIHYRKMAIVIVSVVSSFSFLKTFTSIMGSVSRSFRSESSVFGADTIFLFKNEDDRPYCGFMGSTL